MEAGATQKSLAEASLITKVNINGNKLNRVNDTSEDIKIKVLVLNAISIVKIEKKTNRIGNINHSGVNLNSAHH